MYSVHSPLTSDLCYCGSPFKLKPLGALMPKPRLVPASNAPGDPLKGLPASPDFAIFLPAEFLEQHIRSSHHTGSTEGSFQHLVAHLTSLPPCQWSPPPPPNAQQPLKMALPRRRSSTCPKSLRTTAMPFERSSLRRRGRRKPVIDAKSAR